MKYVFLLIVFGHGLIHLLGFFKGFGIREVKELSLPISRPMGAMWLAAAIVLLVYGLMYLLNQQNSWWIGFFAIILSQVLIILFWKDAKFGTLVNMIILSVSISAFGSYRFQKMAQQETTQLLAQNKLISERIITDDDIRNLPYPVRRWLSHSGIVGKPYLYVGKILQKAEMKSKPAQKNWMNATAVQYNIIDNPAFIWIADVKMNSLIHLKGRDKFENGRGEMLIKLNSLINVVKEKGEKLDEGTIQRFLGEMVWIPSLAISPYVTWEPINDTCAKATMEYKGTKGSGTFYFHTTGEFVKFSALRFMGNKANAERYEWIITADGYKTFEGITVPARMKATWKLKEGDWTWLQIEITDIRYNENI